MSSHDGRRPFPFKLGSAKHIRDQAAAAKPVFGDGPAPRMRPLVTPATAAPLLVRAPRIFEGPSSAAPAEPTAAIEPLPPAGDAQRMQQATPSADGGRAPRRAAMIPAVLTYEGYGAGMPCKVLNMSVTGALIELPRPDQGWYDDIGAIPAEVTLRFKLDRIERDGRIVRRSGREVGVRFTSAARPMKASAR